MSNIPVVSFVALILLFLKDYLLKTSAVFGIVLCSFILPSLQNVLFLYLPTS